MKFNYYNLSSSLLLLLICLGPFLATGIFFLLVGVGVVKLVAVILFFLFFVFLYKIMFIKVTIDENGVLYKSFFREKFLPWTAISDVLLVVRERRSIPDYYKLNEWIASGRTSKSYFLLFRTTSEFPANPMFMFSAPIDEDYISVQSRKAIIEKINQYYYKA
ncbi:MULTISPECIES: PH domain-containing protein [unclassified Myroides]|uniref:PH domain-containing protein n=1 Tax=unclassified Myroides TaxID=2642485 RepID=UPI0015FA3802|nr:MULTISPECIES: PH domain-containing protein [unclassified Myroides]MBB1148626.1 PH domain-containing protein [Myroides sp. NP-2]MDM1406337.1 PH domain-containing protein [Myroides sp. DF42-4-2]